MLNFNPIIPINKIKKYISLSILAVLFAACDKGFDELNVNSTAATSIDPAFILNDAILNTTFTTGTAIYDMGIVQQIVSPNSGVLTGANYNQDNRNATETMWVRYYRSVVRNTKDVILQANARGNRGNLVQMARIWQAYAFMVLTDTYGDVPYSQAGKGFTDQVVLPVYDSQDAIYADIIKELTEASGALSTSNRIEVGDIMYGGDVNKWKRLGYSLLLRAGMRISQVDAAKAQTAISAAFAGGVMQSNTDNCVIKHDANYLNSNGQMLNSTEANNFYIPAAFVNQLKSTSDPRLKSIAVRYVGAASGPNQNASLASTDPTVQIGMPMGYDNGGITAVAKAAGLASFYDYSQIDRTRMMKTTAPLYLITHAQNQLLLAEAATKGWVSGSAATYYKNGIEAHMLQMADYDAKSSVAANEIATYLTANPLGANALQDIGTQYWIASFLNGPEAFANFRRTGYPALTPNPFPGKDISGQFINRLTYPNSEISVNGVNVKAAVAKQGADNLDTKVWWDK
jgi:hypothetical protein